LPRSAIIVDERDNVATALRPLNQGTSIRLGIPDNDIAVVLSQAIPLGHKFALRDIELGTPIVKYGEVIGLATKRITKGEHTHVHNVEGLRGRGDRK
jgi:altronate dehydratase small subunit